MNSKIFFPWRVFALCAIVVLRQEVWKEEERVSDRLTGRKVHLARKPHLPLPFPSPAYICGKIMVLFALSQTQIDIDLEVVLLIFHIFFLLLVGTFPTAFNRSSKHLKCISSP